MKKNFLQDVIPPNQKRSIRDIPIPNHGGEEKEDVRVEPVRQPEQPKPRSNSDVRPNAFGGEVRPPSPNPPTPPRPPVDNYDEDFEFEDQPKRGYWKWVIIILVVVLAGGFWIFSRPSAEVIVYPKIENVFVQDSFAIESEDNMTNPGSLAYKTLKVEKEASKEVPASGEEEVSEKASGTIKIFNEYSEDPQKLVERTRFQSEKGKIYRIAESIEVPGYTENGPGELEVEVFAEEAGDGYNIETSNFTIPGFEGLPQFETMYARSVTDISGGFVGTRKVVSEEDKANALEELKQNAKSLVSEEVKALGDEFIIVFNEESIEYSRISENQVKDGVQLSLSAIADVYVFDKNELARFIANMQMVDAPEGEIMFVPGENLTMEIVNELLDEEDPEAGTIEKLRIDGDIELQWVVDTADLISKLENQNKSELSNVISNNKGIVRAELQISPLWKNSFPKASKIDILIQQ